MPSFSLPQRLFWIAILTAFLVAAGLRFSAADYALPYIVNPDEPNFYRLAQDQRGVLDAGWRADWMAGYPPGYIWFYTAVVEGADRLNVFDVHQDMARVIGMMRIVNSLINLITMALVIRLAGQLGGMRAALLAGASYAISTPILLNASAAQSDSLLTLFIMTSMVCGLRAWRRDSVLWALISTVTCLIAVVVKYPAVPALLLPGLFFVRYLLRKRVAALPSAALALVLVLAVAYGLWFVYGGGGLKNFEGNEARGSFIENSLVPERWLNVFKAVGGTLGLGLSLGFLTVILARTKRYRDLVTGDMLLIGLTGLVLLALVPGYLAEIPTALYPIRYTLPAAVIMIAVASALVVRLTRRWSTAMQVIVGLVCIAALVPDLAVYAYTLRLRNPYTDAQKWFEINVPDQSVLWMETNDPYASLSRYDRGYRGFKSFIGFFSEDNTITTPELRESVDYIYLTDTDIQRWPLSQGWEDLDQFTLIKSFSGPQYNTPYLYIFLARKLPNPQETVFALGDVRLVLRGLSISSDSTISVESYWQADGARPAHDYSYSLYLTPADEPSTLIAQHDAGLGQRPTSTWDDPTEILETTIGPLDLPAEAQGDVSLWLVIYDSQTGERFMLADGTTALKLQTWTIER